MENEVEPTSCGRDSLAPIEKTKLRIKEVPQKLEAKEVDHSASMRKLSPNSILRDTHPRNNHNRGLRSPRSSFKGNGTSPSPTPQQKPNNTVRYSPPKNMTIKTHDGQEVTVFGEPFSGTGFKKKSSGRNN